MARKTLNPKPLSRRMFTQGLKLAAVQMPSDGHSANFHHGTAGMLGRDWFYRCKQAQLRRCGSLAGSLVPMQDLEDGLNSQGSKALKPKSFNPCGKARRHRLGLSPHLFLAATRMDGHSRRLVSWLCAEDMAEALVLKVLRSATPFATTGRRTDPSHRPRGAIFRPRIYPRARPSFDAAKPEPTRQLLRQRLHGISLCSHQDRTGHDRIGKPPSRRERTRRVCRRRQPRKNTLGHRLPHASSIRFQLRP